ncbi:hypothetical protein GCM10020227_18680 [Streptomyces flavovirens]
MRVRHTTTAVLCSAAALTLSGCAGFLVPAGEGEPAPTRHPAQAAAPSGTVRAETLPAVPDTTSAPPQGAPGTTAPAGDCPASGAKVEMGPVSAAMFHRAVVLTLTNCGTEPYQVNGYPAVRALDEDGRRIPVPVNPGGSMFGQDQGPKAVARVADRDGPASTRSPRPAAESERRHRSGGGPRSTRGRQAATCAAAHRCSASDPRDSTGGEEGHAVRHALGHAPVTRYRRADMTTARRKPVGTRHGRATVCEALGAPRESDPWPSSLCTTDMGRELPEEALPWRSTSLSRQPPHPSYPPRCR